MRKDNHVESHMRVPHATYQKLVNSRKGSQSINQRLCEILEEYFQMKEAEEKKVCA
jgi:hypothetical protein